MGKSEDYGKDLRIVGAMWHGGKEEGLLDEQEITRMKWKCGREREY